MATTSPPQDRPASGVLDLPPIRDVRLPRRVQRVPRWAQASVVLVVLLVVAGYLHSRQLGDQLWFNEAIATGIASHSIGGLLHAVREGGSSPLYYLLLHWWMSAVGNTEADLHGLSLLIGLLTIPVGGWIAWSLDGPRAGFYAATLFAFSAYVIKYSIEVQPYTLMMLLGLVAVGAFVNGFVYRRRRWLWLFVIALTAAFYTQASAALFAFGLVVALALVVRLAEPSQRAGLLRDAGLCAAIVLILYIPWIPSTIHQIAHATAPWHYAPLVGADVPGDLLGGERVDVSLLIALIVGAAPLASTAVRRRSPEAVAIWSLLVIAFAGLALGKISQLVTAGWVERYFAPMAATLVLVAALGAARARAVGFAAVILVVIFCLHPRSFVSPQKSNMKDIAGEMAQSMHPGDVVALAQPEQAPLAWYYMPSGFRYASTLGPVSDPSYMNWINAQQRLDRARPAATLGALIASLRPGQQLLYVRPLTEGVQNWKAPWPKLVRRRSAQWGQILTDDVANGTLTKVAHAPHEYLSTCCVASSSILYRKAS